MRSKIIMIKKKQTKIDLGIISKNINQLMESCEIDATELAEHTGLPHSTISRLRSTAQESSPTLSTLIPIADFFCITISQLIGEEAINLSSTTFKPSKMRRVPVPVLTTETISDYLGSTGTIEAPFIYLDHAITDKSFAYLLQGNAMEPQFPDKTLLLIDPTIEIENLDHILVIPSGKKIPLFRQVLIDGEEKYIRTLNPAFNEFIKLTSDSHTILGVMVESRRNFKYLDLLSSLQNSKTTVRA